MPTLLIVGAGLFGCQAAAWARRHRIETRVFDPGTRGAASPAAAGLIQEAWLGGKLRPHAGPGLAVLEQLYGLRSVSLRHEDGQLESFLFVPPSAILQSADVRQRVTAVGDGWLMAGGQRHEGWVYLAAGIWCGELVPGLEIAGRAGAAFGFAGEREGILRPIRWGQQAIAFVRDAGATYFSDGTAERVYLPEHERQSLLRAEELGLSRPQSRWWGWRPYVPGGPCFRRLGRRTWLGTGGRKMGTVLGASFAHRLLEEL